MNIVVGAAASLQDQNSRTRKEGSVWAEARLLKIRPARRGRLQKADARDQRRGGSQAIDPNNARTVTLLVQDGSRIPLDVENENYRIFVRFVPRF